ncbi:MAG: hypothetical protein IJ501_01135 [Bacilli bacterium]|nr:hypothetical protein [Bacilli bacterium]MBQ8472087.1 hypothetical protein [Bacilli bacterium]
MNILNNFLQKGTINIKRFKIIVLIFILGFVLNFQLISYANPDYEAPIGEINLADGGMIYTDSVNKDFYFTATDNVEIAYMKYKGPNDTLWNDYIDSTVISKNSLNGKYSFIAVDTSGNISEEVYVYLDIVPPIIKIYGDDGESLNDSVLNSEYLYFDVSDELCGLDIIYVKKPNSTYYSVYTNYKYLYDVGTYYCYAVDYAGNKTKTYSINLYKTPTVDIVYNNENNTVYLTWTDLYYQVFVNGNNYTKETIIDVEGYYEVKVIDAADNIGYDNFTINHKYVIDEIVNATCLIDGYTHYQCISCDEEYDDDYIDALGHDLVEITKELACTTDGGRFLSCTRCDYEEGLDVVKAPGHKFQNKLIKEASCANTGMREFTCTVCGYVQEKEIARLAHNYLLMSEDKLEDCIVQTYVCSNCGEEYSKKIYNTDLNINLPKNSFFKEYQKYIIGLLSILSVGWSLYMGIMYIIASKKEDREMAKKRIKNYIVGLIIIFIIFMGGPLLIDGIQSLIN